MQMSLEDACKTSISGWYLSSTVLGMPWHLGDKLGLRTPGDDAVRPTPREVAFGAISTAVRAQAARLTCQL